MERTVEPRASIREQKREPHRLAYSRRRRVAALAQVLEQSSARRKDVTAVHARKRCPRHRSRRCRHRFNGVAQLLLLLLRRRRRRLLLLLAPLAKDRHGLGHAERLNVPREGLDSRKAEPADRAHVLLALRAHVLLALCLRHACLVGRVSACHPS